jgi:ATP-binding cassette subfamily B protein
LALGVALAIMIVTSSASTAIALLLGSLVDRVRIASQESHADAYWAAGSILLTLGAIYIFREAFHVVRRALVENSCTRIQRDAQLRLVRHVMRLDLVSLAIEKLGAMHGKIIRSVEGLVRFVRLMFCECFPALLTGVFALGAAVVKFPMLGLVMLAVVPSSVILTARQLRSQKEVRLRLMRDCEEIDGIVVEQLSGAEYVRVANTYNLEMRRLGRCTEKRRRREVLHHFQMSLYGSAKALNEGFFHILVLALATYLAISGTIKLGDVVTASLLFLSVMTPLAELHRIIDEGHEASLRVGDMLQMLREPQDVAFQPPKSLPPQLTLGEPAIEVENLCVDYVSPEGKYRRRLDNVSLVIHHGETIGIAGRSGSGKSTWIKVLLRLVHPESGSIYLGREPLEDIGREDLARLVGYVGQIPFVFSGSIAENIAYGSGKVPLESIRHAAVLANLHDEILEMPGGYHAKVNERGQNLSGGQRQRIALARILLRHTPILILDEATSALDNLSERHVQDSLGMTNAERTTIVIAHRLSTLKGCDRIVVFDNGRIIEIGTYEELAERKGVFSKLVASAAAGLNGGTNGKFKIPVLSPVLESVPTA